MVRYFKRFLLVYLLALQNSTAQSLTNDLAANITALASNTNATWSYNPSLPNLGTNTGVWTWPVNLSCVGMASSGFQAVLLTRNEILTCNHIGGLGGNSVVFYDTNQVQWIAWVSNAVNIAVDLDIAELSNCAPASIVIPYVLPPDYTNYLPSHSIEGLPAFWLHKNTSHIEFASVTGSFVSNGSEWVSLFHNGYGPFGNGSSATPGDSGSPAFMVWKDSPVLLFAATYGNDAEGMFISGASNWLAVAKSVGTNGLRVLDLSHYPFLGNTNQTPPPPTNLRIIGTGSDQARGGSTRLRLLTVSAGAKSSAVTPDKLINGPPFLL